MASKTRKDPQRPPTQRRGKELRRHILVSAKEVFLDTGFERASMDAIAARAHTSKRSIYAYFEDKETLFIAALELVRELYLDRLGTPEDYAEDPDEAVARFCGRFLQMMVWDGMVKTCRLVIADAERLPESANDYFEAIFTGTQARLGDYLVDRYGLAKKAGREAALTLLSRTAFPRVFRTLLNVEPPIPGEAAPPVDALAKDVDLAAIRAAVAAELPA